MAETFACPHCGAVYPVKPVLIGRPVRCTNCREPFKLHADGTVEKIDRSEVRSGSFPATGSQTAASQSQSKTAYKPQTLAGGAADVRRTSQISASHQSSVDSPVRKPTTRTGENRSAETRTRSSARLSVAQERTRRMMSSTLSAVAAEALESDLGRRDSGTSDAFTRSRQTGAVTAATASVPLGDRPIGPAVLTDQGVREARSRRNVVVGLVLAVLVVVGLFVLLGRTSPEGKALAAFSERADDGSWAFPYREELLHGRFWLWNPALPLLNSLDPSHIVRREQLSWTPVRDLFNGPLSGRVVFAPGRVLVSSAELSRVETAWDASDGDRERFAAALAEAGVDVFPLADLGARLGEVGLEASARDLFLDFFNKPSDSEGNYRYRDRFLAGDVPALAELAHLEGDGYQLVNTGTDYRARLVRYRGRLLRFPEAGWRAADDPAAGWRLLDLEIADERGRFAGE